MESDNLAYRFWTLEDGATMASTLSLDFGIIHCIHITQLTKLEKIPICECTYKLLLNICGVHK